MASPVRFDHNFQEVATILGRAGVQLYSTELTAATLPLDHPELQRCRRPQPVPPGPGLAGGVLAVRVADLVSVDSGDGTGLLAPAAGPERRRVMSLPLVARLVMAMTLMPNASYVEVFARLVGVLPRLPWVHGWRIPRATVVTAWRRRLGVAPMRALFARVAGHIVTGTELGALWHGLRIATLDGLQVKIPDSEQKSGRVRLLRDR